MLLFPDQLWCDHPKKDFREIIISQQIIIKRKERGAEYIALKETQYELGLDYSLKGGNIEISIKVIAFTILVMHTQGLIYKPI